jgi:hypothetical protein
LSNAGRDEIAFVEDEDHVFGRTVLLDMVLHMSRPGSHGVSSINDLNNHVGGVQHFVQFSPNTFALTCFHSLVPCFISDCLINLFSDVRVLGLIVLLMFLLYLLNES